MSNLVYVWTIVMSIDINYEIDAYKAFQLLSHVYINSTTVVLIYKTIYVYLSLCYFHLIELLNSH